MNGGGATRSTAHFLVCHWPIFAKACQTEWCTVILAVRTFRGQCEPTKACSLFAPGGVRHKLAPIANKAPTGRSTRASMFRPPFVVRPPPCPKTSLRAETAFTCCWLHSSLSASRLRSNTSIAAWPRGSPSLAATIPKSPNTAFASRARRTRPTTCAARRLPRRGIEPVELSDDQVALEAFMPGLRTLAAPETSFAGAFPAGLYGSSAAQFASAIASFPGHAGSDGLNLADSSGMMAMSDTIFAATAGSVG